MTPVAQDKLYVHDGIGNGNCFPACLASILEIPLWMIPPFDQMFGRAKWGDRRQEWLERMFKLRFIRTEGHQVDVMPEFYTANGFSPRDVMHSVVYSQGRLVHDPHPVGGGIAEVEYTYHLEPSIT